MNRGFVRVIGGKWRGRRLPILSSPGLRPTADRVRETLFNWLSPVIVDAVCLDLFAGTGVLGFEALSRGAAQVVMVDQAAVVIQQLKDQAALLKTDQVIFCQSDVRLQPSLPKKSFDIIFLDPPYHQGLIPVCCDYLIAQDYLSVEAMIYVEAEKEFDISTLPSQWKIVRDQFAGQVHYLLLQRSTSIHF